MLSMGANHQDTFFVHINQVNKTDPEMYVCVSSSGASEQSHYKRNEKLDQKISLYSSDITKLEIGAIVNAGMCGCLFVVGSVCRSVIQHAHQLPIFTHDKIK